MNIILIGFMGSGKTTLAKLLADELNYTFIDSDQYIESREKKTIPEIFKEKGELYFREKEKEFLFHARLLDNCVISTGAGLPCSDEHIKLLNQLGWVIWINVDEQILVQRLSDDIQSRPKLMEFPTVSEAVTLMLQDRKRFYRQARSEIKNPTVGALMRLVTEIV